KIKSALPSTDISIRRGDANRHINFVIESMCEYANSKYKIVFTPDEATAAIIQFLKQFSIECLRAYTQGTAIPNVSGGPKEMYVTCSFIHSASESNPQLFESI